MVFASALDGLTIPLTSDGDAITYALSNGGTLLTATAEAGTRTVFTIALSDANNGDFTITLLDNLDHDASTGRGDSFGLGFGFVATDGDGDQATGTLNVTFEDDAGRPSIGAVRRCAGGSEGPGPCAALS